MAKKPKEDEIGAVEGPENADVGAPLAAPEDPAAQDDGQDARPTTVSGSYCRLVNMGSAPLDCPLADGTHVNLGPKCAGREIHKSKPILKKLRTAILFSWKRRGRLAFEECAGGE